MKGVVCTELTGEDGLRLVDDWPVPGPLSPAQIRIDVHAGSVNFPDTLVTRGLYQVRKEPPFVIGAEAAGIVTEVGSDVTEVSPGDRVLALTGFGAFAEQVVATPPFQHVHRIPDEMSFAEGAAFDLTFGTSGHALLQRGGLVAGETVLVNGAAGGCGSAAVQIAKAAGARVIAVVGGPAKADLVSALGADEVIDHHTFDRERALSARVAELTGGQGVEVVVDNTGENLRDHLRCLAWNGRLLVVGFAAGQVPTLALNLTVLRSISAIGVAYGASAIKNPAANKSLFAQLFEWYRDGKLAPHLGHRFPLVEAADAVRAVHDRSALGKVVIEIAGAGR